MIRVRVRCDETSHHPKGPVFNAQEQFQQPRAILTLRDDMITSNIGRMSSIVGSNTVI